MHDLRWPANALQSAAHLIGITESKPAGVKPSKVAFTKKSEDAYRKSSAARTIDTPDNHEVAYRAHKEAMECAPIDDLEDFGMHAQHAALHYRKWKGKVGQIYTDGQGKKK